MHALRRVAALLSIAHLGVYASSADATCRCTFGDPCWPNQTAFDELASKVSQPLLLPVPPASTCYPPVDASACADAKARWSESLWRADQPGAMQDATYERFFFANGTVDACYLDANLTGKCAQGSIPVIGIDARTVEDVQAGVNFAREHNLRLVVKNTGHDFLGRSTARGAFVIWTHRLKGITVHDAFHPESAPDDETYPAITIGGGDQWHDVYAAADAGGRAVLGGVSPAGSVGAGGGWPAGGGHSMLSPTFGLGVDNILEISVVTAFGLFLTVNKYRNADLFWALRGGGGGTFGVVTGLTYRTHPITPFIASTFSMDSTSVTPAFQQVVTDVLRELPDQTDAGWGGYATITGTTFGFVYGNPSVSQAAANETFGAFFERTRALADASNGTLTVTRAETREYPSFFSWLRENFAVDGGALAEVSGEIGSWLLPRELFERDVEHVAAVTVPLQAQYYSVGGGAVSKVDPDATGLNPAWRKALVHTLTSVVYPFNASAEEVEAQRQQLRGMAAKLRELAPESGAYFNEASLYEPDFRHSFFGTHYERLKAIKAEYDPNDLFVVAEGVGSEDWDADLNCRLDK